MSDFPYLLARASRATGTILGVAMLLEVEPKQVYRWIAGVEQPSSARIEELTQRLQTALAARATRERFKG